MKYRGINHGLIKIINFLGNKNISEFENQLDSIFESLSDILLVDKKDSYQKNIEEINYFCEKKVIKNIIILSNYKQKEINLKIIKYISIFISNSPVNNDKNKFNFFNYICENKYLNKLIINLNYNFDEKDEDYLSYYINFLKVIANKINRENIKFIFNIQCNIFPLLDQILLLLNNDDIMIRNSARNIFLSFIKLNYSPLIEYLCDIPRIAIFIILMRRIKSNILLMINLKNSDKNIYIEKTKEFKEKIIEDLLFMQDILSINIYIINYIIINCFFSIILSNLFMKIVSFSNKKNNLDIKTEISKIMNVLRIIFKNIKNENIKNILCFLVFSKNIYSKINEYLTNKNFQENKNSKIENAKLLNLIYFNFNYCYSKMKFDEFVISNYSKSFLKSFRYIIKYSGLNENSIYIEIKEISNLLQLKDEKDDIQLCIGFLNDKLVNYNNNFIIRMYNFHSFISEKTGINCGIFHKENNESFLSLFYSNFVNIQKDETLNSNYFQNNLLRTEILCFLENEIKGSNGGNKNIIFNIILLFIEIINDNSISNDLKKIMNILKNNNNQNLLEILIDKGIDKNKLDLSNSDSNSIKYPDKLIEPINQLYSLIINEEKLEYSSLNFDKNFFGKICKTNFLSSNIINENSELIINIIDFLFYPKFVLNNNDIILCFRLIESLFNEFYHKNEKLINYLNSLYLQTLLQIKEILFKNNNDIKNGIFKFSYSYFEKSFYLNQKSLTEIINKYYSDLKVSSFVIIENSVNSKEKETLKNLFQKFISLHDLLNINSYKFKDIDFPLKLIKEETNFKIGGKVDINEYNLKNIDVKFIKLNNDNKKNYNSKEENLTMFIYNNYLFFALSPENVAKYDINSIDGEKNYLIRYMFCLRCIKSIKEIENFTLLFFLDENEYKFNIYVKLNNEILYNKLKKALLNGINNSIILEYSSISSFINNKIIEYSKISEKKK